MGPLGWASVAWVVGLALGQPGVVGTLIGLSAAVIGASALAWRGRWGAVVAALGLALMLVGTTPPGPEWDGSVRGRGRVVGAPSGAWADVAMRGGVVRARFPGRAPALATELVLRGDAAPVDDPPVLPGAPNVAGWAAGAGVRSMVRVRAWATVGGAVKRVALPDGLAHGGLLRALATGDRSEVAEADVAVLRATGTAHLLAVSGFHVGLVVLLAGLAGRAAVRPLALLRGEGWAEDGGVTAVGVVTAACFAMGAGAPVSAQRAVLVAGLLALGRTLGRDAQALDVVGAAAVLVTLWDPAAVGSASFQLSFGAVVGIVRLTPWLQRWLPSELPGPVRWASQGAAVSLGATMGTLPAAAWWFQAVAPLGVLANLVAIPVVSVLLAPAALVACWGPQPLARWGALLGEQVAAALLWSLHLFVAAPWTPAFGPTAVALAWAALLAPRGWVTPLLALVALALAAPRLPPPDLRVTFLDVGQGDAALVEYPDGRTWLVDGGPPGDAVLHWLRREGVRSVDVVVCSHAEADHAGGLLPVLEALEVGELWLGSADSADDLLAVAARRGVPVRASPTGAVQAVGRADANNRSLVLVATWAGRRVLFTGDIEAPAEAELARSLGAAMSDVDVLKVPHHGSRTSSSETLLAVARPEVAVVSVGRRNRYAHPAPEVIERYEARAVPVVRTDQVGTVQVELGATSGRLRTFRARSGWSAWTALQRSPGVLP